MSDDLTQNTSEFDTEVFTNTLRRWYHVLALVLAVVAIFPIRIQSAYRILREAIMYLAAKDPVVSLSASPVLN